MSVPRAATYDEFLRHLNIPGAGVKDEAEVLQHLGAATGAAEGIIGPIVHRAVTSRLVIRGGSGILTDAPIASVTQLVGLQSAPTYAGDVVSVDPDTGIVSGVNGRLSDGEYLATYTAGRAATETDVSDDIRLAVCIIGKHLYETQRGRGTTRGGTLGGNTQIADERVPAGYLIPHRARSLLEPYEPLPVA